VELSEWFVHGKRRVFLLISTGSSERPISWMCEYRDMEFMYKSDLEFFRMNSFIVVCLKVLRMFMLDTYLG